ncbi:hypothetical protein PV327_007860 [Microctonus hyperodae]|uniref:Uncharacterized protein n=1 Tax=Microctonus hyperodae TaxID=165561 RepID=A0AA39KZ20_MICHY|nr:hypothetical protein PV327_007860 [Microctonus hyperodae]
MVIRLTRVFNDLVATVVQSLFLRLTSVDVYVFVAQAHILTTLAKTLFSRHKAQQLPPPVCQRHPCEMTRWPACNMCAEEYSAVHFATVTFGAKLFYPTPAEKGCRGKYRI